MPFAPGTAIGPYEIISLLGAGGMGEVYRAHDPRLRRDVAIKVISRALATDAVTVDRFIREALSASALNHPNVVTIYETGDTHNGRYIAMELVQGVTLREALREGLDPEAARDIGRQVAEALAVAHGAQIVHRDVKPENVMVREDGYVKVLDFGLARVERVERDGVSATVSFATGSGLVIGTVGYMSPEQARGEMVTAASDVFSLGVVMYEALTGQHPFPATSALGVMHAILTDVPVAPSHLREGLPGAYDQIVLECLQKDPRLRPTAHDVANVLKHASSASLRAMPAAPSTKDHSRTVVGRSSERGLLDEAWAPARAGNGSVVAVAG
jgi:serine/threonine protein kinase